MTVRSNPCAELNLDVLLDGDEDSDLYRRTASHIESCPKCQQRLTELSGDPEHWAVQREMLRPVSGDRPDSGLLRRYRSPESAPWRCQAIDESTVKELLAAPSHPEMLGRLGRYEIERIIGTGGMGIVLPPHVIHKVRAKAALAEGKQVELLAELARCQKLLPGDVRLAPSNAMFAKRLKHFEEDELKTLDGTESDGD